MAPTPVRSRRASNKLATRARILAAAKSLFATQGFTGTTVDELAERSRVSRATFFNYFATKDAVLTALWADQLATLTGVVDELVAQPLSTADRLRLVFDSVVEATEREPGYLRVVTGELERGASQADVSDPRYDRFHTILRRLITAGLAQGDVRTDFAPDFLAQMVGAVFISVLRAWRAVPDCDLAAAFADAARFVALAVCVTGPE